MYFEASRTPELCPSYRTSEAYWKKIVENLILRLFGGVPNSQHTVGGQPAPAFSAGWLAVSRRFQAHLYLAAGVKPVVFQ